MLDKTPNLWYNKNIERQGPRRRSEMNNKQFLVDITEHFIEINDRGKHFNNITHVIKDTEHYKAGDAVVIHSFQDVNGYDRPRLTVWHGGQYIRARINN